MIGNMHQLFFLNILLIYNQYNIDMISIFENLLNNHLQFQLHFLLDQLLDLTTVEKINSHQNTIIKIIIQVEYHLL